MNNNKHDFNQNNQKPNNQNKNQGGPTAPQRKPNNIFNILLVFFLLTTILNIFTDTYDTKTKVQIEYSQFIDLVENKTVNKVVLTQDEIVITLDKNADKQKVSKILESNLTKEEKEQKDALQALFKQPEGDIEYYTGIVNDPKIIDRLVENDVAFTKPIIRNNPILNFILQWIVPIMIFYFLYSMLMRSFAKRMSSMGGSGGGLFNNPGQSKAKKFNIEEQASVTFADVAGQDEAKESLTEIVDFLHNPKKYAKIGARQPKGALLVGPPGTGKTLLARATAGEAKVPFFYLSGSEFVEMFVGVGASRVRDLFEQATKQAPCIIFIDEIDAIGKSRDNQMGSNEEREQTLNQLLAEMDGFDSTKGIVVLAATNRPEVLDKALMRPGRLDRQIIVDKPDLPGRESILEVHAKKVKMNPNISLREIALSTSGATGADLANMINEAALRAVRLGRDEVLQEDLQESVELVIAGKEKKDRVLNEKEKRMVSYHEVGHALASALQKHSQPVQKITIIPRTMGSLGYTMQMPEEERYLLTKEELEAQIVVLLAGRSAEEIEFGVSSTGASNDIERATKIARSMVTQYGMSETFDMMGLESAENRYLDGRNVSTASEATGQLVDKEINQIIVKCHETAKKLLKDNHQALKNISEFLIEKETITGAQFMELLEETNGPIAKSDEPAKGEDVTILDTPAVTIDERFDEADTKVPTESVDIQEADVKAKTTEEE